MARVWRNAEVVWDTDSDPYNPGWVVHVEELMANEWEYQSYLPHPNYCHMAQDANADDLRTLLQHTAEWENAAIIMDDEN